MIRESRSDLWRRIEVQYCAPLLLIRRPRPNDEYVFISCPDEMTGLSQLLCCEIAAGCLFIVLLLQIPCKNVCFLIGNVFKANNNGVDYSIVHSEEFEFHLCSIRSRKCTSLRIVQYKFQFLACLLLPFICYVDQVHRLHPIELLTSICHKSPSFTFISYRSIVTFPYFCCRAIVLKFIAQNCSNISITDTLQANQKKPNGNLGQSWYFFPFLEQKLPGNAPSQQFSSHQTEIDKQFQSIEIRIPCISRPRGPLDDEGSLGPIWRP